MKLPAYFSPSRDVVILAASACTVMSGAAIAPSIPAIQESFSAHSDWTGWGRIALVLPAIVVMFFGPLIGRITSGFDQKKVLVGALLLTALTGAAGGVAPNYTWMLITRAGLGFTTAAVLCAATTAIATHYDGPSRGKMIGAQMATNTFGGVVFVLLGGLLAELSWRGAFSLYLLAIPIALAAFGLCWSSRSDGLAGDKVKYNLSTDYEPITFIAIAMTAFYLIPTQIPFLNTAINSASGAGLAIATGTLMSGVASLSARKIGSIVSDKTVLWLGMAFIILGLVEIALSSTLFAAVIAAGLVGIGFGLIIATCATLIMKDANPANRNSKSGWIASALYAGQVFAVLIAVSLEFTKSPASPFWAMAIILMVGFFIKVLVKNKVWVQKHLAQLIQAIKKTLVFMKNLKAAALS